MYHKVTLREIGQQMHATAQHEGSAHRTLGKGLQLNYYRSSGIDGVRWMLVLSRTDVPPSALEVAIVRRDFDVPKQAEEVPTGRVVTLSWMETTTMQVEQHALFEEASQ